MENKEKIQSFFEYCKSYIIDNIEEHNDRLVYACDLGITLTENMCCDGSFTYSTAKAKEYLIEWFFDAGEFSDYEKFNFGERSNPFENVEMFLVRMLCEGVRSVLSRCDFIKDNWDKKIWLHPDVIATIKEQVEEQTDDELF